MKKKKYAITPQELWNPAPIERWLEVEAAKGWRLTRVSGWFVTFEKTEPKTCRVRLQPVGPESRKAWEERTDIYAEMGWVFAVALQQYYEIYYCDDPAAPELDTDPAVYALAWKDPLRLSWLSAWGVLALACFILLFPALVAAGKDEAVLEVLLRANLRSLCCVFVLAPVLMVQSVRKLLKVRKARKVVQAGLPFSEGAAWRKERRWQMLIPGLLLTFLFIIPVGDLIVAMKTPDTTGIPYVTVTELAPETKQEDWHWDIHRYAYYCRPLAPTRVEMLWRHDPDLLVRNSQSRLLLPTLAKAVYRLEMREFEELYGPAEEKTIVNEAFDEAVLLTAGNAQLLVVRSGTVAYALEVNFPVPLENYIGTVASEMRP